MNQSITEQYEVSKYKVSEHTYPVDLFNKEDYGGNYVLFFINVNESSKLARNNRYNSSFFVEDTDGVENQRLKGELYKRGPEIGLPDIVTIGTGAAIFGRKTGFLAGLTFGLGAGSVLATAGDELRQQKRLRTAIALHVPNNLKIEYKTDWAELDTALFTGILDSVDVAGKFFQNLLSIINGNTTKLGGEREIIDKITQDGLKDDFKSLGGLVANLGLNIPFTGSALSVATGLAANPKKEQIFQGIGFREFSYEYQFFARNKEEAWAIRNIIQQFKYHMHPEYHTNHRSFLFYYPSEFDISYYTAHKENTVIHKHPSSVLTNMKIDYTPNSVFSVIDDEVSDPITGNTFTGMPSHINITLEFKELAILTKDEIRQGY